MGMFDGLRDAATLRSYEAARNKGELEAGAAAVVAVNRLGSEGLQRIDPGKATEIGLQAIDRVGTIDRRSEASLSAKSALEGWMKTSPLPDTKTQAEAEDRYSMMQRLGDDTYSSSWDKAASREAYRSMMLQSDPSAACQADSQLIRYAEVYAADMTRQGAANYPADERAGHRAVVALLDDLPRLRQEAAAEEAIRPPTEPDYETLREDQDIAIWEDQGIAAEQAKYDEQAQHFTEDDIVVTSSRYDFDETGREYAVSRGKSDGGFHFSLTDANADNRAWSEAFASEEEAETALQKSQAERYSVPYERGEPEALHEAPAESKSDRTPEERAAFNRAMSPPVPDFSEALKQEASGPSRGPR